MAQPVYSIRMLGGTVSSSSPLSAVVPTGKTWVIRHVTALAVAPGSSNFGIVIPGLCFIAGIASLSAGVSFDWEGHQVLNAGETLEATLGAGSAYCMASGYQLNTAG